MKKIISALLVILMLLTAVACGANQSTDDTTAPTVSSTDGKDEYVIKAHEDSYYSDIINDLIK